METQTENTAAGPAMSHPDSRDKYAPANLTLYRTSLALVRHLVEDGVFSEDEYVHIRAVLNKKYNLPLGSIFAENT